MKHLHGTRRSAAALVAGLVCTAGGLAVTTAPALAKKTTKAAKPAAKNLPVAPGSQYLALGDSVTFGYEEPQVTPAPDYPDAASFANYPQMLGSELHLSVANAACSGETSASLINSAAPNNGCTNNPAHTSNNYRANYPLHVRYKGSQLAYALSYLHKHHNVRLVTLMIGANDFFVCQETTSDSCGSAAELSATEKAVTKNIRTILSAIRNKAHYEGQLVIVNYYSLNYGSTAANGLSALLNQVQDSAAKPYHVKIADGFGELQAAAAHSGGDTCAAGLLTQIGGGKCGIHPSYAGQALLAQALAKAIKVS